MASTDFYIIKTKVCFLFIGFCIAMLITYISFTKLQIELAVTSSDSSEETINKEESKFMILKRKLVRDKRSHIPSSFAELTEPVKNYLSSNSLNGSNFDNMPWFSEDDKMWTLFLSQNNIASKFSFDNSKAIIKFEKSIFNASHLYKRNYTNPSRSVKNVTNNLNSCFRQCALAKRPSDILEVLAYHLDRVLGLKRTLPTVARKIPEMPSVNNTFANPGVIIRPLVAWDPRVVRMLSDEQEVLFTWGHYRKILEKVCGRNGKNKMLRSGDKDEIACEEWTGLAMFDFLLQNYDRVDPFCCGYEDSLPKLCASKRRLCPHSYLTNIFIRKNKPSRLVFLDNRMDEKRADTELNYRMLTGIGRLPQSAVEVMKSTGFPSKLLRSVLSDHVFSAGLGGHSGVVKLINILDSRAKILINYMEYDKTNDSTEIL